MHTEMINKWFSYGLQLNNLNIWLWGPCWPFKKQTGPNLLLSYARIYINLNVKHGSNSTMTFLSFCENDEVSTDTAAHWWQHGIPPCTFRFVYGLQLYIAEYEISYHRMDYVYMHKWYQKLIKCPPFHFICVCKMHHWDHYDLYNIYWDRNIICIFFFGKVCCKSQFWNILTKLDAYYFISNLSVSRWQFKPY